MAPPAPSVEVDPSTSSFSNPWRRVFEKEIDALPQTMFNVNYFDSARRMSYEKLASLIQETISSFGSVESQGAS